MKAMKKAILTLVLAGVVGLVPASAATITGLFNTGVNDMGVVLADGATDTHYRLTVNPNGVPQQGIVVIGGQFPIPPWILNSSTSKWIGPQADQSNFGMEPVNGNYTYRLTFVCVGLDCGTTVLNGNWSSDNVGNIFLNSSMVSSSMSMFFGSFTPFSISGLVQGTNTLDFVVNNAGSVPTASGLRVEISSVPEPGTMMLGALGLLAVGLLRRRRP